MPYFKKFNFALIMITLLLSPCLSQNSHTSSIRMGSGDMTFETVPGWGLGNKGKSILGSTHGNIVIDRAGNIYTSSINGVTVFSSKGEVVRSLQTKNHTNIHDMEIREEMGVEYIYAARDSDAEGIKFRAKDGKVMLRLGVPEESGLTIENFHPTAITVDPSGNIFLSDGYGSNTIFKYDQKGNYISHFGKKGNGLEEFNTAHGMTIDTRYDPVRLLICDREHQPKGRLVHYDLNGNFIGEVITGLGLPTAVSIQGDYVAVPDLLGKVVILDKQNIIVAVLGYNHDTKGGMSLYEVEQHDWVEGEFSGSHGASWDQKGNLYVQDWNVSGRIMKLRRITNR